MVFDKQVFGTCKQELRIKQFQLYDLNLKLKKKLHNV
jgi:hypothetical protein